MLLKELAAGTDSEFAVDVPDVDVDRVGGSVQLLGDLTLGEALEQQVVDLQLGPAQGRCGTA